MMIYKCQLKYFKLKKKWENSGITIFLAMFPLQMPT